MTPLEPTGGPLDEDRRAYRAGPDTIDDLFAGIVAQTLNRPPTRRERLRALPGAARAALGMAGGLAAGGIVILITGLRGDLDALAMPRLAGALAALLTGALVSLALALRGSHHPPLGKGARFLAGALLLLPLVSAAIPGAWEGSPTPRDKVALWLLECMALGLPAAALAAAAPLALSRWDEPPRLRVWLACAGGGLMAFAAQQMRCTANDPLHLLVTHAGLGAAVATVFVVLGVFGLQR
jgi:hypothetical protein